MRLVGRARVSIALNTSVDAQIGAIAEHQRARVARKQLLACGIDSAAIARRLHSGRPRARSPVEVDAYGRHGSPARFEPNRRRDARLLTEAGIVVLRLTAIAVEDRPFEVVALVARAIGQRETESRYDPPRSRSVAMGSR